MSRLHAHIAISSALGDVWEHLVDWERMHTWFLGVKRVTLLAPEASVGATRLLQLFYGPVHREQITRWEPPNCFSVAVIDAPFIGRDWVGHVELCERPTGVEVSWELRYQPRFGVVGRIVDALVIRPCLDIVFRSSLRRLRALVEAGRTRLPPG